MSDSGPVEYNLCSVEILVQNSQVNTETLSSKSMSTTSVQKCAAHTSNVEEGRGVDIKSDRNNQDVC